MKKRWILAVSLLLAGFLILPAAAEEDGELPDFPEEAEELEFSEDEGGWLFQEGSFTGPQSLPDEPMVYSAQTLYNTIYNGLIKQSSTIDVSSDRISSKDILTETYYKVINDHPELYYARTGLSWWTSSSGYVTRIEPKYFEGLPSNHKTLFEAATKEAMAQIDSSMSDLEKALVLHDYLVVNCAYNWGVATRKESYSDRVYSAYGVLVDKDAVCQGYALAYKYLLNLAGIPSVTVSSDPMNHMWNMVQMDGKWYHADVTYDDPVPNQEGRCYHSNFLVSDSGIARTNHHDWVRHYTCSDTTFESGYAFNGVRHPMYCLNGDFYYIKNYSLWYGDLEDDTNDTEIKLPYWLNPNRGVVWLENVLYYIDGTQGSGSYQVRCYDLMGEESYYWDPFSYTETASPDGSYDAGNDSPGLRYYGGVVQVVSPNRRQVFYSAKPIEPKEYPAEWDNLTVAQIAGVLNDGRVGVKQDGRSAVLWVVGYGTGKKMTSLTSYILPAKSGITLVDVKHPSAHGKLIITDSRGVPLGNFFGK